MIKRWFTRRFLLLDMTKKIKDNESVKPLIELLKTAKFSFNILDKFPFIYKISPQAKKIKDQFIEIEQMSNILYLPDQFNDFFAEKGWICYSSLPSTVLETSVQLAQENHFELAYELLINTVDEVYIDLILKKCKARKHFQDRLRLLELLKIDYLEQRYHACIPLLLALIDGSANDISKHIGFFTENLELELFDSMTAHSSGLPFLKKIMNASRTKTNEEEIRIPYRNGILHGRDLNFNNKEVASKCWWALASLIDWADEKQLNKQPKKPTSLQESFNKYQKTQELSKQINLWRKRQIQSESYWKEQDLETIDIDSPEYTLLTFLAAWKTGAWGKMTPLLLHNVGKHIGKATGEIKNDYQKFKLINYQIKYSKDQTPATTKILMLIEFMKNDMSQSIEVDISLNYADSTNGLPKLRGEPNGQWYILQLSLSDILFK